MNRFALTALIFGVLSGCTGAAPTMAPTTASPATPSLSTAATPTPRPAATPAPALTATPSPSPTLLARGSFKSKGATVELDATGAGSSVQGVMTMFDVDFSFTVDLECEWTTPGGLLVIGGDVTDSSFDLAPQGSRVAMVFEAGSPVRAHPHFEEIPPAATCLEFLESVTDEESATALEPIEGQVELGIQGPTRSPQLSPTAWQFPTALFAALSDEPVVSPD